MKAFKDDVSSKDKPKCHKCLFLLSWFPCWHVMVSDFQIFSAHHEQNIVVLWTRTVKCWSIWNIKPSSSKSHPKYTDIFWPYSLFHIWLTKPCYYYCTTVKICRLRGKGIIWKLQIIVLCRVFYSQEQCIGTHVKWQCKKGLHIHHSLRTIYVRLWKKFEARDYADIISLIMQLIWDFFPSECLVL